MRINIFFLAAGIFIFSNQVVAQTNPQDLTKTIAEMDSLLFYAFNTCDINLSKSLFTEDLEVYPIKDYGAIQIGSHRFYYTEKGHEEKLDGTFKFIHIWKNVNGDWKISRVISYDH